MLNTFPIHPSGWWQVLNNQTRNSCVLGTWLTKNYSKVLPFRYLNRVLLLRLIFCPCKFWFHGNVLLVCILLIRNELRSSLFVSHVNTRWLHVRSGAVAECCSPAFLKMVHISFGRQACTKWILQKLYLNCIQGCLPCSALHFGCQSPASSWSSGLAEDKED